MASDHRVRVRQKSKGKIPYTRRVHYNNSDYLSSDDEVEVVFSPNSYTSASSPRDLEESRADRSDLDSVDCAVQSPAEVHLKDDKFSKVDLTAEPEFKFPFSNFDLIVTLCSILFFIYDFFSDVVLANRYFYHRRWLAFGFTAGFIAVPALLSNGQSLRWYLIDYEREKLKRKKNKSTRKTHLCVWIFRILLTFPLMLGPVVRHVEYIYHGQKSKSKSLPYKDRRYHYKQMLYEDNDAGLVRMFEAFLEAAPQLVLQLFILITEKPEDSYHMKFIRPAAMLGSWIGMAWSLVSYHRALRCMQHSEIQDKNRHLQKDPSESETAVEMSLFSVGIYFLWRAAEVGPRLVVLSLFASQFTYFVLIIVGAHWLFMTAWLLCQKTTFYDEENRRDEIIFNVVLGYAMIFCFLNARDGHTRYRALIYYVAFYAENFLMLMMWVYATPDKSDWYYFAAVGIVPGGLILHLFFQLLYYKVLHPKSEEIKMCLNPTERYSCYQSVCHDLEDENQPPAFV